MNRKILLAIKISFTSIILAYIFIKIPFYNILKSISSVKIILFLLAFLISIPVILLSSLQTKYLTTIQKMSISFKEILIIYLTTSFYSLFLPGSLSGGAVKWYKFKKFGSKSSAAVVVVFNRYLEIFIVILIGLLCSIPTLISYNYSLLLIVWFSILILLCASYIFLLNTKFLKIVENLLIKIPIPLFVKDKIGNLFKAMQEFQNLAFKDHVEIIIIMLSYHFLSIIAFYLLAASINISLSILVLGWIRSVVTIANMLPISYSGLGVREGLFIYLLHYYGVLPSDALVMSFLTFAKNLLGPVVGGIIELKDFLLDKSYKSIKGTNV